MKALNRLSDHKLDLERWGGALQSLLDQPRMALSRIRERRKLPRRVGLALSGGAERGIAHVGVLAVLEREGIVPDLVAGTSAGAAIGAIYCAGWSTQQMVRLASGLNWSHLGRPRWNLVRSMGILDGSRLDEYICQLLGDLTFDDLSIPLTVVAVDLLTSTEVPIESGPLGLAVRASCSVPGLFTPVPCGDQLLVDGGLLNNLPISCVLERGADYIIGVDVSLSTEALQPPRHIFDVLEMSYVAIQRRNRLRGPQPDCLIQPVIGPTDRLNIGANLSHLYHAGMVAAEEALPQLKRDLSL